MKHVVQIALMLLLPAALFAQSDTSLRINANDRVYDQWKAEGKIDPNAFICNSSGRAGDTSAVRVSAPPAVQSSVLCQCIVPIDASFQVVPFTNGDPNDEYRNDDGSTAQINLPFQFCFYGQNINSVYINNNGNVSFGAAYGTFTANSFPDPTFIMIAPFWADVDTRGAGSGIVYYKLTANYLIVRWQSVGYYSMYDDKLNDFQLIITDGSDPILPAGNNVSFCYGDMQWTTGDASGGTNGFGGNPATVGVNRGNGVDYIQIGQFDQAGNNYDGPFGANDQVSWLDNQTFYFNVCNNGSGNNLPPIVNSDDVCDTIWVCVGDTVNLDAIFLAPEQGQSTTITLSTQSNGLTTVNITGGNPATMSASFAGSAANLGSNLITLTGTDNGAPPASTTSLIVIQVVNAPLVSFSFSPASPAQAPASVQFTANTPGAVSWFWNFGDGGTSIAQNPSHTFIGDSVYTVTLTAFLPSGCFATYSATYEVIGGIPVVAPNVVTPNGDGNNDQLVFTNLHYYSKSKLRVYDRWGALIYSSDDYQNNWTPDVVDGVYYYEITGLYIYEPITGFFHVLRTK
jgi:gliding motility-associated-like protein